MNRSRNSGVSAVTGAALAVFGCVACSGAGSDETPMAAAAGAGGSASPTAGGSSGTGYAASGTAGQVSSGGTSGGSGGGSSTAGSGAVAGSGGSTTASAGAAGATGGATGDAGSGGAAGAAGSGGESGASQGGTANAPPGTPPDYTLQFEETFATPAAMDRLLYGNPGDWSHVAMDGGYAEWTGFSYNPPYRSPFSMAIIKDQKFASLVLEVEVIQTSMTGGHRDFCVMWNVVDPSHFYYAHIGAAHDGVSHNIHIVNDADRTAITTMFDAGFDWGVDTWKKIRLVRDAVTGSMEIYGDDAAMPMLTASDTTFTDGYVGIGAFDDTGKVRNLRIWAGASTMETATFFEPLQ